MLMKKHKFNIFPEMSLEEFNRLKEDMQTNGFDPNYPIMLYDNQILDGWNRYRACEELKKTPLFDHFAGNDEEAMALVMRSNKRRNLSDERLTALALQSDDMMKAIQKQVEEGRRAKLIGNDNAKKEKTITPNSDSSILRDKNENTTIAKIAETIGVKKNQVEKIMKLQKENPVGAEQVADGKTTTRKLNAEKKAKLAKEAAPVMIIIDDKPTDEIVEIIGAVNVDNKVPEGISEIIEPVNVICDENNCELNELTDEEILEYVTLAKIEVKEISKKIITEGVDYKSLPINQQHFQAIVIIQRELGEVLTGYKSLRYGMH
jgi:hypothetical protein